MKMAQSKALFLLLAILSCTLSAPVAAKLHVVGSSFGWEYPPNVAFYRDWAAKKTFVVGDKLVFPFRSSMYNLVEASKEDFPSCTRNKVLNEFVQGPAVLNLTEPGSRYFFCSVGLHCEHGMKFSITVLPSASATAPALPPAGAI